ncbi:MAG: cytochrome P450 [Aeromicrobium erythreum]
MTSTIPTYRPDLYSRSAVLDPYPHYRALRDLGPVVRLPRHGVLAVARHEDCRRVLRDDAVFVSGQGVGLNRVANRVGRGTTLNSDGTDHEQRRSVLAERLTPRALRGMRSEVEQRADAVVASAVERGDVDAVADVARALPTSFVPDLIGWPEEGREHLLRWAGATFDALGPLNRQSLRTAPSALGMLRFARGIARRRDVRPGSLGADLLWKADRGEIERSACPALMIDYLAPSLDTTISAIASAVLLLARHPEQWEVLKREPERVPNAVNEVVRLESPLRAFSRVADRDTEVGGVPVARGSRVLVVYASANRDERTWEDATAFDVTRDAGAQLGFGQGVHGCAGQGLARLETQSILTALLRRVERIELTGTPTWGVNNVIHSLERLPVRLVPVTGGDR